MLVNVYGHDPVREYQWSNFIKLFCFAIFSLELALQLVEWASSSGLLMIIISSLLETAERDMPPNYMAVLSSEKRLWRICKNPLANE